MLIATDSYLPQRSGIVRSVLNLCDAISLQGGRARVAHPNADGRTGENCDTIAIAARSIPSISVHPVARAASAEQALMREFDLWRPDVVHVHTPFGVGMGALRAAQRSGITSVLTIHMVPQNAVYHTAATALLYPITKTVLRRSYRRAIDRADFVSAPSATAARLTREAFSVPRCVAVSNGITKFSHEPTPSKAPPNIIYVGRLSKEKNVDILIDAFSQVAKIEPDVSLRIVGTGPLDASLARRVPPDLKHRVWFLGDIPDDQLVQLYTEATIFCMPSSHELECIAALEALSFGLPVVVADRLALSELAEWSGCATFESATRSPLQSP